MPKIVDHHKKKEHIIDIAYQNVQHHGKAGTSVRSIANAANMTTGQIRYYYPNQAILIEEILNKLTATIEKKIKDLFQNKDEPLIKRAVNAILLTMPLDQKRRADMIVWLAVQDEKSTNADHTMSNEIYVLSEKVFDLMCQHYPVREHIKKEKSVRRLHALIDGLALHKLYQPNALNNDLIEEIITDEIQSWME